jgi:hypothetical protein
LEGLMRRTRNQIGESAFSKHDVIRSIDELGITPVEQNIGDSKPTAADAFVQQVARKLSIRFQSGDHDFGAIRWSVAADQQEPFVYRLDPSDADEKSNPSAACITVAGWAIEDRLQTVMVVAGAMARHVWQYHQQRDLDVQPQTTSLLPIVVGLGILASEAALLDRQWSTAGWSGWSLNRFGHYNAMEIGYAMALTHRSSTGDPTKPTWLPKLRLDSRVIWKQAIRYFQKMDKDCKPLIFDANVIPSQTSTDARLASWIAGSDTSFAYASCIVAANKRLSSAQIIDAALSACQQKDSDLVYRAIEVLHHSQPNRDDVRQRLWKLSTSRSLQVAFAAAKASTACGVPHVKLIPTARRLLAAESFDLLPVLAWIEDGETSMSPLMPILRQHLDDAKRFQHQQAVQAIEHCIERIEI